MAASRWIWSSQPTSSLALAKLCAAASYPGGKGANQAVAAARLGADVSMPGCVEQDVFGQQLLHGLQQNGIDTRWVHTMHAISTGIASILYVKLKTPLCFWRQLRAAARTH